MTYTLDTSTLIAAWTELYPIDVFPGFWDLLAEGIRRGTILISEEVFREVEYGDDDLARWLKALSLHFVRSTEDVQASLTTVMSVRVNDFAPPVADPNKERDADPWVMAVALTRQSTVVSKERSAISSKKKAKIPDVCQVLDVKCINLLGLLRSLGVTMSVQSPA